MKYEVNLDRGVKIAGQHHAHGAVVDTDSMVPTATADSAPSHFTDEEKANHVKTQQESLAKQAQGDLDGHVKDGYLVPAGTQTRSARTAPATKEG